MQEMKDRMIQAIYAAIGPNATRKIKLQIKQESGWSAINRLLGMSHPKVGRLIHMSDQQRVEYEQIWDEDNDAWDDYWNDPNNRVTTIEFTPLFIKSYSVSADNGGEGEVERFSGFMCELLESVEVVG